MTGKTTTPLGPHNTFRECDTREATLARNTQAVVHPFMVPLLDELAKKRPHWRYVFRYNHCTGTTAGSYSYPRFDIEDGGEVLGSVNIDTHWRTNEHSYELHNPRLRSKRERGSCAKTKHCKKAVKLILENYYKKSLSELLADSCREMATAVSRQHQSSAWEFNRIMDAARDDIAAFFINHPEVTTQISFSDPKTKERFDKLPKATAAKDAAKELYDMSHANTGIYAVLRGEEVVLAKSHTDYSVHLIDKLEPKIAAAVGILKLVDHDQPIPGVGMRISPTQFFINPKDPEE